MRRSTGPIPPGPLDRHRQRWEYVGKKIGQTGSKDKASNKPSGDQGSDAASAQMVTGQPVHDKPDQYGDK